MVTFNEARRADGLGSIRASEMTPTQWDQLQKSYRVGELLMPCCQDSAIPKVSPNGYRHFSHAGGACSSSEESQWHVSAKGHVLSSLLSLGCEAGLEVPGKGSGGRWQADVWGELGNVKLAVEVQRSYQHLRTYRDRQAKYRDAGVNVLWILRQDRYVTLTTAMSKERLREEFGGRWPASGHFSPCLPEVPVVWLDVENEPTARGAGFFSAQLSVLLKSVFEGRFLWSDGLWCIDNLESMRERAAEARATALAARSGKVLAPDRRGH